jgi:hypothetical protein
MSAARCGTWDFGSPVGTYVPTGVGGVGGGCTGTGPLPAAPTAAWAGWLPVPCGGFGVAGAAAPTAAAGALFWAGGTGVWP